MEIHQLEYFTAIVDEGSFTAAAHRLHVTQSGVSTQVAKLERELGQPLFARGRTVALTPAGEALLPLARNVLVGLEAISATAEEFAGAIRGTVRLGVFPGCAIPGFLDVVAGFRKTHPGITLRMREDTASELHRSVLDSSLDIALTGYAGEAPAGVATHLVRQQRLCAFSTGDLLLPDEPTVADVQQHPVLCLPSGSGVRSAYDRACELAGRSPRVDIEASSPHTLLGLAERGGGVAVLPSTAATGLDRAAITDASVPACLGLISKPEPRSPATRLVLESLTTALALRPDVIDRFPDSHNRIPRC